MPISGDLFRGCSTALYAPALHHIFFSPFSSLISVPFLPSRRDPSRSLSPTFASSRLVSSFHSATLCLSPIFTVDAWHRVLHACYLSNRIIPSMLISLRSFSIVRSSLVILGYSYVWKLWERTNTWTFREQRISSFSCIFYIVFICNIVFQG